MDGEKRYGNTNKKEKSKIFHVVEIIYDALPGIGMLLISLFVLWESSIIYDYDLGNAILLIVGFVIIIKIFSND